MLVNWIDECVLRATGHAFDWMRVEGLGPETLSGIRHVHDQPDGHFTAQLNFAIQNAAQRLEFEALMARLDGMRNTIDLPVPLARCPLKAAQSVLVGPHMAGSYQITIARPEWADVEVLPGQFIGVGGAVHKVLEVDVSGADGIIIHLVNPLRRTLLPGAGPNLLANGSFDADIAGWTAAVAGSSAVSWSPGRMLLNRVSGGSCRSTAPAVTIPGRRYAVAADTDGALSLWLGVVAQGTELLSVAFSGAGARSAHFIARTSQSWITFAANADGAHYTDNVTISEDAGAVVTTRPVCRMRLASPGQGQLYYDLHKFATPGLRFIEDVSVL